MCNDPSFYDLESFVKDSFKEFIPSIEYHRGMDLLFFTFRDCSYWVDWHKSNDVALLTDNHVDEGQSKFVGFAINGVKSLGISPEKSLSEFMFNIAKNHPEIVKHLAELLETHGFKFTQVTFK